MNKNSKMKNIVKAGFAVAVALVFLMPNSTVVANVITEPVQISDEVQVAKQERGTLDITGNITFWGYNQDDDIHDVLIYIDDLPPNGYPVGIVENVPANGGFYVSAWFEVSVDYHNFAISWYCDEHDEWEHRDGFVYVDINEPQSVHMDVLYCRPTGSISISGTNNDDNYHNVQVYLDNVDQETFYNVAPNGEGEYSKSFDLEIGSSYTGGIRWYCDEHNQWHETEDTFDLEEPLEVIVACYCVSLCDARIQFQGTNNDNDVHNIEMYIDNMWQGTVGPVAAGAEYSSPWYEVDIGSHTAFIRWWDEEENKESPSITVSVGNNENKTVDIDVDPYENPIGYIRFYGGRNLDYDPHFIEMYIDGVLKETTLNEITYESYYQSNFYEVTAGQQHTATIKWEDEGEDHELSEIVDVQQDDFVDVTLNIPASPTGYINIQGHNNDNDLHDIQIIVDDQPKTILYNILSGGPFSSGNLRVDVGLHTVSIKWWDEGEWRDEISNNVEVLENSITYEMLDVYICAYKEWTFMVYGTGDNSLSGSLAYDYGSMLQADSYDSVNVVVLRDYLGPSNTYLTYINSTGHPIAVQPSWLTREENMGDPQTLEQFIQLTFSRFPSEHTFLVFWDHGLAWRGCCIDNTSDDNTSDHDALTIQEIENALTAAVPFGEKIDVIAFDACLMANLETYYHLREHADYFVGSETISWSGIWDYSSILWYLNTYPEPDLAARYTVNSMRIEVLPDKSHVFSAVDVGQIDVLTNAVNNFAMELQGFCRSESIDVLLKIMEARVETETYRGLVYLTAPRIIDLRHFAENIQADELLPGILRNSAQNVINAMDNAVICLLVHQGTGDNAERVDHANGISIFYPNELDRESCSDYYDTGFALSTQWDEFINAYNMDEYEGNDPFDIDPIQGAIPITTDGTPQFHNFHGSCDIDWVRFTANRGTKYTIETTDVGGHSNPHIYFYGSDQATKILETDHRIEEWLCLADGDYYIGLLQWNCEIYGPQTYFSLQVISIYDTINPDTEIIGGPTNGETIYDTHVTFTCTGSDNFTPTENLQYSYKLEPYDISWSIPTASTSKTYNDLPVGRDYTFRVKAIDLADNADPTPAERTFTVPYPVQKHGLDGSDEGYFTIQNAIDETVDGDTIFVYSFGSPYFVESLDIDKSISLIGQDKNTTIIQAQGTWCAVTISADGVSFCDFTIESNRADGILVTSDYNLISNCDVYGNGDDEYNGADGIFLTGSSDNTVENCDFHDYLRDGISLQYSSYNTFINCNSYNNNRQYPDGNPGYGIYLWGSSYNTFTNCYSFNNRNEATETGDGIKIASLHQSDDHNNIEYCTFYGNVNGIFLSLSGSNTITHCNIHGNYKYNYMYGDSCGIRITRSSNNAINGCDIHDNYRSDPYEPYDYGYGIFIEGPLSYNNDIAYCNIYNASDVWAGDYGYGVCLGDGSSDNIVYYNNFNNSQNAFDDGDNSWDNENTGNYWHDYSGGDANGDGIGDTPYMIPDDAQDRYPLMEPWVLPDTTPPDTEILTGPSGPINYNNVVFTWAGSDDRTPTPNLWYQYRLVGQSGYPWSDPTSITYVYFEDLSEGSYTFMVKSIDEAGNEDPTSAERSFRVDITPPLASISINNGTQYTNTRSVTLSLTYSDNGSGVAGCKYRDDGSPSWPILWEECTPTKAWTLSPGDEVRTVSYRVRDHAGNVQEASDMIILDTTPPELCDGGAYPDPCGTGDPLIFMVTVSTYDASDVYIHYRKVTAPSYIVQEMFELEPNIHYIYEITADYYDDTDLEYYFTAVDAAGNPCSTDVETVPITDDDPPVTTCILFPDVGDGGVDVALDVIDNCDDTPATYIQILRLLAFGPLDVENVHIIEANVQPSVGGSDHEEIDPDGEPFVPPPLQWPKIDQCYLDWTSYSDPIHIPGEEEGWYVANFYSVDNIGNSEPVKSYIFSVSGLPDQDS